MLNPWMKGLLIVMLSFSSIAFANNLNPLTAKALNELLNAKIEELEIPPAITVGQQKEGGIVIWGGGSGRSGIVAALENDPLFTGSISYFPYDEAGGENVESRIRHTQVAP